MVGSLLKFKKTSQRRTPTPHHHLLAIARFITGLTMVDREFGQ
ncbi:MAG: hypothetical protein WCO94_00990 [Verrucomicrobiota bacterium]